MKVQEKLKARSLLLQQVRAFFMKEGLLEVETPLLRSATTTDPYLDPVKAKLFGEVYYLQSSPEYAMKELLASGSGSIFQICKAFRSDELGRFHRPEFTMLEWYCVNYDLEALKAQVLRLLNDVVSFKGVEFLSYAESFGRYLSVDPFELDVKALQSLIAKDFDVHELESFSKDECLHLLFSQSIEPKFDPEVLFVVDQYPASQAALANTAKDSQGRGVAKRFEVFLGGIELANAYEEELSEAVLRSRFNQENKLRLAQGKEQIPIDEALLSAMGRGLPRCSGIAMGLDRLLMLKNGSKDISEVLF